MKTLIVILVVFLTGCSLLVHSTFPASPKTKADCVVYTSPAVVDGIASAVLWRNNDKMGSVFIGISSLLGVLYSTTCFSTR